MPDRSPFNEPLVQDANASGCIFYDDPATLRDDQIDPLLRKAVRQINRSGWVWTAESCQGHPDATGDVWAGNTRPMLRLVCRVEDRPRMMDALVQAFAESNNWADLPTVRSIAVWPYERRNGWFEALVYVPAATAGERDLGCKCYERFAELVDPLTPDPFYSCGAGYCDDPACITHNREHPNHSEDGDE